MKKYRNMHSKIKTSVIIGTIIILAIPISSVSAGGPRLDSPDDSTREGANCWVDGYDAGFAGKYDKGRADECANEDDEYNESWDGACENAGYTLGECEGFKNNPVNIEDHGALQQENAQNCWNDGYEDGKADNPFNEDRDSGCDEYSQ
jgi:hypothetical protein